MITAMNGSVLLRQKDNSCDKYEEEDIMDKISIKLLSVKDQDGLFDFETRNRKYFERIGLSRSDAYYERSSFVKILKELIDEQQKDAHYMYLVINEQNDIVGRVNLTDVVRGPLRKAELGYRIGEQHQGKGFATAAVRLVLMQASKVHELHRIEAGTSPQNIGSQVVLIKNGFRFAGKYSKYILQGDDWVDSLLFEKVLD